MRKDLIGGLYSSIPDAALVTALERLLIENDESNVTSPMSPPLNPSENDMDEFPKAE
jgi:hypothetical protein